jgi:TetR/AcrR family transcriptional regulator, cholesterol catabolism regulator
MNKGHKTKEVILQKGAELFADKGYAKATMKDICEVTGLSRGGLYRYFSSTKEIFIELLNRDHKENSFAVEDAIKNDSSALDFFENFLLMEKKAALSYYNGIFFAVHEFIFHEKDQKPYIDKVALESRTLLAKVFTYGQERGEFRDFDVDVVSKHILHLWDSIKTSASIITITEEDLDKQIEYIKEIVTKA